MLVENRQYADAKFVFLSTNSIIRNGVIDFYGYEADYFIPLFHLILTTEVTTSCSLSTCSCINTYKTYTQSEVVCHINVVFKVDWLYPKPNHFSFFCLPTLQSRSYDTAGYISEVIHLNLNELHFYSATLWNGSHYTYVFSNILIHGICMMALRKQEYLNQGFQFLHTSQKDIFLAMSFQQFNNFNWTRINIIALSIFHLF